MENLENWSILRKFDENTCYNVVKNTATNETYLIDYELDGKDCSLLLNEDVVRLCQNSNKGVAIENWKINGTPVVVTAEKLSGISESEYKTRNTEYWAKGFALGAVLVGTASMVVSYFIRKRELKSMNEKIEKLKLLNSNSK